MNIKLKTQHAGDWGLQNDRGGEFDCQSKLRAWGSRRWIAILALACLTVAQPSLATAETQSDSPVVTAAVSNDRVQVAEPFTFELKVTAPGGTRILLPAIGQQVGSFDVVDHQDISDVPASKNPGERTWSRRLTLESITTGDLEIPGMEIQVGRGSSSTTIQSDPIPVHVISVLEDRVDPTQIRDIHSVVDVEIPQSPSNAWLWWTAGGVGFLALAATSVLVVARRKTWLTPSQWAMGELEILEHSDAVLDGDGETVSQRLSSIIRDYLELQFEFSAPAQTTQELLNVIESRKLLDSETTTSFGKIFELADQAKFAGLQMTRSELVHSIHETRQLVCEADSLVVDRDVITEEA